MKNPLKKPLIKKLLLWGTACFVAGILFTLFISYFMSKTAEDKIYSDVNKIPAKDVAVVLGTSRYMVNGYQNQYFTYRIKAASELYHAGKVKKILVSGDNSVSNYNEPLEMFSALIEMGVDPEDIVLDFAGFRTFDSMVRAKEVFGLNNFIVVSQEFHCERAIYIANAKDIAVTAYTARDPYSSTKTNLREYPARVSAFLDCYIIKTKPHFLGEKIDVMAGI